MYQMSVANTCNIKARTNSKMKWNIFYTFMKLMVYYLLAKGVKQGRNNKHYMFVLHVLHFSNN